MQSDVPFTNSQSVNPPDLPDPMSMTAANAHSRIVPAHPPTVSDKMKRAVWRVCWMFLGRLSPTPMHGWRRALLRLFGARVEAGAHVYPSVRIWAPQNLVMERGSCLADGVDCYNVAPIRLGPGSVVSQRAFLCAASHAPHEPNFPLITGPINIGTGAWVAAEAFIGPGVKVGNRAVLAARGVAVRDIASEDIVAGNPARIVATRNSGKAR